MFTIFSGFSGNFCDRMSRRSFLKIGALGLGGLALPELLRLEAAAQANGSASYVKDKAVVLLFLSGGPSQLETFDPKPGGLEGSTSIAGHVPTALPGVRFASYLPKLARLADRLTIVRSFQTNHGEHSGGHKQLLTGDLTVQDGARITEPGIGAVCSRVTGAINQQTGMPRHAIIPPTTRHTAQRAGFNGAFESVIEGSQPTWLGQTYAPLQLLAQMRENTAPPNRNRRNEPANPFLQDLEPSLPAAQFDGRLDLLRQLDALDRRLDADGTLTGMDIFRQQAVELLRGDGIRQALDLSREDPRVLEKYDTEHFRNWNCDEQSRFIRNGPSIGISLGRQMLLARRLCEAGCGFVTVIHPNWDFHARKNIPNMPEGMGVLAPPFDHAVAAFLEDVEQRGLSDKILLVITGEFGRTPGLDRNLGRHHWPKICPLVLAGGGLRHGQVVGQSDRRGGEPSSTPLTIADLQSTILHALFDVGRMRLDAAIPRQILERAERGRPIAELF